MKSMRFVVPLNGFLLITLIAVTVLAIIIGRAPYLHDFAEWLYQGQIVKNLFTGGHAVANFTVATYPVPNSLATLLLAGLSILFPPLWAGKIFLISIQLAWYPVLHLFTGRFTNSSWRGAATLGLYALTALSTFFWYGFISYQLGLLFLTLFFAIYRDDTSGYVIAAFGLAIFLAHAIVLLVFLLFLGARLLLSWNKNILLGLVPTGVLSLCFLVGRHLAAVDPQRIDATWSGWEEALIYKAGYPAMLGPFKNFIFPEGISLLENQPWIYWAGLAANFTISAALGVLVLITLYSFVTKDLRASRGVPVLRIAYAVSLVMMLIFYLFAPYHFFGLINSGGRLLLPILLMSLMLGGGMTFPLIRVLVWPVILFSLVSSGSYLYLMAQTQRPEFAPVIPPIVQPESSDSVFDYNEQLYGSTRYRYFNYRIFVFAHRFDQIESGQYGELAFRTGMLIKSRP
jgi:hypothetical protein